MSYLTVDFRTVLRLAISTAMLRIKNFSSIVDSVDMEGNSKAPFYFWFIVRVSICSHSS